mgnify:FL=1|jgi:hypothetical protein|tara:strand:+ start:2654 stop:3034 length:381 start_codon:yes stop_codon:yes gene_type:complete
MTDDDNIKSDYDKSRDTYYDLIEKGQDALSMMMEVARESEHPRAYEVLSGMIKNVADVNDKLMDLNKKNKDINKSDVPALDNATTNNNVFIGSTTDLQRMLQDVKTEQPEAKVNNVIDITPRIKDE